MRRLSRGRIGALALLLGLVVSSVVLVRIVIGDGGARCPSVDDGSVATRQVRISTTPDGVEIELWSRMQFPVRALSPVLQVGDRTFLSSRHPEDGSLHTLIFHVPTAEFERLTADDPVLLYYGTPHEAPLSVDGPTIGTDGASLWAFGTLRTELRDCDVATGSP